MRGDRGRRVGYSVSVEPCQKFMPEARLISGRARFLYIDAHTVEIAGHS